MHRTLCILKAIECFTLQNNKNPITTITILISMIINNQIRENIARSSNSRQSISSFVVETKCALPYENMWISSFVSVSVSIGHIANDLSLLYRQAKFPIVLSTIKATTI